MSASADVLADHWFAVARSDAVREKPTRVVAFGIPLVVVRGPDRRPWVFEDRCPHRGAALSRGRMTSAGLTCPYHGWSFGADGHCTEMPGYQKSASFDTVRLDRFATHERDGLLWISRRADNPLPERIQALDACKRRFLWQSQWAASVIDIQENFLDALHTHIVHPGLVRRTNDRRPVNATLRVAGDGFHVDYTGQPDQSGLIYKLFESRRTRERAYFSGLATAQLEYQYASNRSVWITLCCTPIADDSTHVFGMLHVDGHWAPSWLIRLLVWPFVRRVARQDQQIVEHQQSQRTVFPAHRNLIMPLDIVRPYLERAWGSRDQTSQLPLEVTRVALL